MIVCDTSGILAAIDSSQRDHQSASRAVASVDGPFILSPFVLAELDYLLADRIGQHAELAFLEEVELGVYRLQNMDQADVRACRELIERYPSLKLGLADASIVVLADRFRTHDLLTLDERHFRAVSALDGQPFRLIPMDVG